MEVCMETTVSKTGTIELQNVPFPPGEIVEVVVRPREMEFAKNDRPLHGEPIGCADPYKGVARDDWEMP